MKIDSQTYKQRHQIKYHLRAVKEIERLRETERERENKRE